MQSFKVKIEDWTVAYKKTTDSFHILHDNEEKKVVKSKKFGDRGMLTFPATLLKLVRSDLTNFNKAAGNVNIPRSPNFLDFTTFFSSLS